MVRRWRRDGVGDFGGGCSLFGCFIHHVMVRKTNVPGDPSEGNTGIHGIEG